MNNKKPIDFLIVVSLILFIVGILGEISNLSTISFLILLFGLIIKNNNKDNIEIKTKEFKENSKIEIKRNLSKSSAERVQYFKEYMNKWLQEENKLFNDEYICYNNNCCPNCGCILDKKIIKSKKCPECKEKILLKTNRLTSKKMLMSEKRANEYNKCDAKRREILYFEDMISKRQYLYKNYMNKFYELKSRASDPRNVVYPFVVYVGTQLDSNAYKKYMKIVNLKEKDMALESFEIIKQFNLANMQYFLLAEIAAYKGRKDVALDDYASAAYRGVQISILDSISNPYHKMETIDIMGNVYPGIILKFLKESDYSLEDFKKAFLENRHPFVLEQLSNEESWEYMYDAIKLYNKMELSRK